MLAPERYIVGSGAVDQLAKIIGDLGQRALVLADRMALSVSEKTIAELRSNLKDVYIEEFSGECTEAAIQRTAKMLSGFDVAVCLGGGKAIDTGKAAACTASLPYVTVPTSAATCAAYTPLSILHTDGGAYMESRRLSSPPAALVLDPLLTITAPPRLLSAGVVDAAARAFDTILAARISVPTIEASLSPSPSAETTGRTCSSSRRKPRFGTTRNGTSAISIHASSKPVSLARASPAR